MCVRTLTFYSLNQHFHLCVIKILQNDLFLYNISTTLEADLCVPLLHNYGHNAKQVQ